MSERFVTAYTAQGPRARQRRGDIVMEIRLLGHEEWQAVFAQMLEAMDAIARRAMESQGAIPPCVESSGSGSVEH